MQYRNYTNQEMLEAIKSSRSVRQVLSKLGLREAGGNYNTVKQFIIKNNINTDHFGNNTGQGQAWSKGKTLGPKKPISHYLNNHKHMNSHNLKNRLIKEKIFEKRCSCCLLDTWNGKEIPLELDHIDGNNKNNSLDNLRILCPNCHAQTPTYRKAKSTIWKNEHYTVTGEGFEPSLEAV